MKTLVSVTIFFFFFFLVLCPRISVVTAQNSTASTNGDFENNRDLYGRFSPSMAVIVVILVSALFFMGFFTIYIRHCTGSSGAGGSIRRGLSMRARRAAAARGLDASVIESFPTFTYAEVKDHKIGKGALECAVCLNEFEDEETLRLLPKCDHVFHPECVDAWLQSHVTCPVCRANLVPQPGDEIVPESTPDEVVNGGSARRTESANNDDQIVIQINDDDDGSAPTPRAQREGSSFDYQNRSVKRPNRMFSFSRFRSHSTGHNSLVQPGENLDRFTLRLPAEVRKEVIHRASLNRTRSFAAASLPREGSSRRGYRTGGEGSSRAARFFRRIDTLDRAAKSDRWALFTRAFSMKSPRVVAETGGEGSQRSGSIGRTPVKLPSFKCLEPSAHDGDERRVSPAETDRSNPV